MSQEKPESQKLTLIVALLGLGGVIIGSICGVLNGPAAVEVVKYVLYGTPTPIATVSPPTATFTCTPTATSISILVAKPTPTPHKPPTKTPTPTNAPTSTPTPTTTPTPKPDAVVNVEALNLRSGPDTVYDVLGVLKQGDPLKVTGKCPAGDWLKVIAPGEQEGWTARSLLQVNVDIAGVPVAQPPPTPTPIYTPTPTVTPTPELLLSPSLLEPENGASFAGWSTFRWQWKYQLKTDEYFSFRVYNEEEGVCHHTPVRETEYVGGFSYCFGGEYYWQVVTVRKLCENCPEEQKWQPLSQPSEERLIYYQPVKEEDEPWEPSEPSEPSEQPVGPPPKPWP